MKVLFLAILLTAALCEEFHFYHYQGGDIIVNKEKPVKVSGPIFIEFLKTMNITVISGMHEKGAVHTPFAFVAKINTSKMENGNIEIIGSCWEGGWGTSGLKDLVGIVNITGTPSKINYFQNCSHQATKMQWIVSAKGEETKCPFYLPPEAAKRAHILVGEPIEKYQAVHVPNFAMFGYPYINSIKNCSFFLDKFINATEPKPGFLVVGKDGKHCGLFDKEGDKFIHSNPVAKKVSLTSNVQLKNFFPAGYVIKEYKC